MKYIKIFIAGIAFPSTLLPCLLLIAWILGKIQIFTIPFLHFIPVIWGIWNILYFSLFAKILSGNLIVKLLITGAVLGFLIAIYGIFVAEIPQLVGFSSSWTYFPLIAAPIVYALFWVFIVNPLNHLLGIYEK
jgi:hypothetical protein